LCVVCFLFCLFVCLFVVLGGVCFCLCVRSGLVLEIAFLI